MSLCQIRRTPSFTSKVTTRKKRIIFQYIGFSQPNKKQFRYLPSGAMMVTIVISHEKFNGFKRNVILKEFSSVLGLCQYMKSQLVCYLHNEDLGLLVNEANNMSLHCHDHNTHDSLVCSGQDLIYLCHGCHNNEDCSNPNR